jgi:hypothetical protein
LSAAEVLSGYVDYRPATGGSLKLPNGSTLYAGAGITIGSTFSCFIRYASGIGAGNLTFSSGDSGSLLIHNGKNSDISEGGGSFRCITFFVQSSTQYIAFLND